jgi:phosphoheptose isomerase
MTLPVRPNAFARLPEPATPAPERISPEQRERVRRHFLESAAVKLRVAELCTDAILDAAGLLERAFRDGGKLLLCGNGGSAADCQHLAAEFVSRLSKNVDRPALPAMALTTDTSFLTAFANDCGFDGVFARQVEAFGRPGDVLIGISTSGSSINVLRAVEEARRRRMHTIALCGQGGALLDAADVAIAVPSLDTQFVQESHVAIEHVLAMAVERALFAT